jgi:site-specific DNA-cytosine methylase
MIQFRTIDLFCGVGGFSSGLEAANWEIVAGVDIHEPELATFGAAHSGALPLRLNLIGNTVCGPVATEIGLAIAAKGRSYERAATS